MTHSSETDSISVVVPTYNRAQWIARTLTSVLDQSRNPLEVIVVDDGSVDDTEEQCRRFGNRVRYVRQSNSGVSRARNHGVSLARGQWVAFCDSDDVWVRDKLAVQIAALKATGALWSITSAYRLDVTDKPVPGRSGFEFVFPMFRELRVSPTTFFSSCLAETSVDAVGGPVTVFHGDVYPALFLGNFALPSAALVNRAEFLSAGGFDESLRLAEDTEFFHRLSARASVAVSMSPLVGYRITHADSLASSKNATRLIRNALESVRRASRLRAPNEARIVSQFRRGEAALLTKVARTELSNGNGTAVRTALRELWAGGRTLRLEHLLFFVASFVPVDSLRVLYSALPARLRFARRRE